MTDLTYGNGKVLTQSFDQDYRLTSKNTSGLYQLGYGYTPRNNIDAITDALDSSKNQSFSYDVLARLTDASGQYGIQNYSFDAIGNRLTKTQDGVTESYTYSSTSHRLDSVGSTNLTYDAAGNTLTKGDLTFTYNQVGRLATASKTGMNASYVYNAQGQRVKKIINDSTTSATTLYHYDQGGQLIAETDGQGSVLKEYLYLDGMRIATVDNGSIYYVHTDHLGAPLALTDSSGTVQWKGSYDPYGNVTVEVNNLEQSQRFPGQRYNKETGLHYNYFRDYDPEIGRYLQSDPVGLDDGANTYLYSRANPVNRYDPNGLTSLAGCMNPANAAVCAAAGITTGAAVGGATGAAINAGAQAYDKGWDCIDWDEVGNAGLEGMYWGAVLGGGEALLLAKMGAKAPGLIAGAASQAPKVASSVFQTGVNITPKSVANKYPIIGSGGRTFVTSPSAVTKIIGPLKGGRIKITPQQGRQLEGALGLKPNSLESRNIISIIQNIPGRAPASPVSGNSFFQGGGAGLPGGGAEFTIQGIPSAGGQGIRQIILEIGQ